MLLQGSPWSIFCFPGGIRPCLLLTSPPVTSSWFLLNQTSCGHRGLSETPSRGKYIKKIEHLPVRCRSGHALQHQDFFWKICRSAALLFNKGSKQVFYNSLLHKWYLLKELTQSANKFLINIKTKWYQGFHKPSCESSSPSLFPSVLEVVAYP